MLNRTEFPKFSYGCALMGENRKILIYLDQNIINDLRDGESSKDGLSDFLKSLQQPGAMLVYSDVHLEECRAFYDPDQYAKALDENSFFYMPSCEKLDSAVVAQCGVARKLICSPPDFFDRSNGLLLWFLPIIQYISGWLGDVEAEDIKNDLIKEVDLWISDLERELRDLVDVRELHGLVDVRELRGKLLETVNSIDLEKNKLEAASAYPTSKKAWNERYARLDRLAPGDVFDHIMSEIGGAQAASLRENFPKGCWPKEPYRTVGTLAGLAFLFFMYGVHRDSGVRRSSQQNRIARFLAQFRDCRHIEAAARCDLFVSNDAGARKLACVTYAHAGVPTQVASLTFASGQ